MPISRVPLSKREKEKIAIDRYVKEGILEKVKWNNTLVLQYPLQRYSKQISSLYSPSQTINKAIERPICQMPTLNEHLHKLQNAKCFTLIDLKDGKLDENSSKMTTMYNVTVCAAYHLVSIVHLKNFKYDSWTH